MACFLVPAAEAIVVTAATKYLEKKNGVAEAQMQDESGILPAKVSFTRKLHWLINLLWGGVALLAFEHVWHGEVTPWFPFLTAAGNAADTAEMLHEMSTAGVAMALLVTAIWGILAAVTTVIVKRAPEAEGSAQ